MKPKMILLTQQFLLHPEQSIYRDAVGIKDLEVSVVAYRRANEKDYPFDRVFELAGKCFCLRMVNAFLRRLGHLAWNDSVELGPAFSRVVRQVKPVLIMSEFGWAAARLISQIEKSKVPLVMRFRGTDINSARGDARYFGRLMRVFEVGTLHIFNSEFLRSQAIALGCPAAKSIVIYPGVKVPERLPEKIKPLKGFRLLCVGRLQEVKGQRYLLEAMRIVRDQEVEVQLTVVGGGPLEAELRASVIRLGLERDVILTGAQPARKVQEIMSEADALVLPSVRVADGQEEAFGVAMIEASALGLPVIGTHTGGIPESIVDGETGYVVQERSASELASAISKLAKDPERARAMGEKGRSRTLEKFEIAKQMTALDQALLGVIK